MGFLCINGDALFKWILAAKTTWHHKPYRSPKDLPTEPYPNGNALPTGHSPTKQRLTSSRPDAILDGEMPAISRKYLLLTQGML